MYQAEKTWEAHGRRRETRGSHRDRLPSPVAWAVHLGGVLVILAGAVAAFLTSTPTGLNAAPFASSHDPPERPHQANTDCTLLVPDQPLTAKGLATPYQLSTSGRRTGDCREANPNLAAFVQAAVLDPATGTVSIYDPLVTTRGVAPAATPVTPTLPAGAVVALWFGFNGQVLRLRGAKSTTLSAAKCVTGTAGSPFGQVSYCNTVRFFQVANQLIQASKLTPPALGTGQDGQTCPTVRDFSVVDQDQSDNVTTSYLVTADGRTAQNTAANATALGNAGMATNGSDNRLLAVALDSALGCIPWMAPDLANGGALTTALPLDELQAAQDQQAPVATVPAGDPMVLVNGRRNLDKQNRYRAGVDQTAVASEQQAQADMRTYCENLVQIGPQRLLLDRPLTSAAPSPMPAVANSLFTFLAQRFAFTFGDQGLNCAGILHRPSPVIVETNAEGIAIGAVIRN
jgi:hypothetical protein